MTTQAPLMIPTSQASMITQVPMTQGPTQGPTQTQTQFRGPQYQSQMPQGFYMNSLSTGPKMNTKNNKSGTTHLW